MLTKIKDRLNMVNDNEDGAEVIQVVLIATLFVVLIGALAVYLKAKFTEASGKMNESFTGAGEATSVFTP